MVISESAHSTLRKDKSMERKGGKKPNACQTDWRRSRGNVALLTMRKGAVGSVSEAQLEQPALGWGNMFRVEPNQRTQLKHLIKGLLPVARCHWRGPGVLEVLAVIRWRLLVFRIGVALVCIVCCLRRILHGGGRRVLPVTLAARFLVVVGVCFSTLSLRHLSRQVGR